VNQLIKYTGKLVFDPPNKTKKHELQSEWKKVAIIEFGGDLCDYYAWFIKKRFNLILNRSVREPHVTFINDSVRDISTNNNNITTEQVEKLWEQFKTKWSGKEVDITLNLHPATNNKHWWFVVDFDHREELHKIRKEIGLPRPFFGLHMTIGLVNPLCVEHSEYIDRCIKKGLIF